ncbi:hypothetical protein GCM10025857_19360 [Alicyclobacillus contaminans]|uniref:late competence development ComFB family protein n=1 Tax=Alicyclobacillus contaminans TaxID=392016 RepID=UPI000407ED12|nr:late competence development ComFB family protein [Alicyclobacillus contaminans]GMA50579.1 hypothetical protein GCM10025857_19360 [Alicyclobacillus contaminans]
MAAAAKRPPARLGAGEGGIALVLYNVTEVLVRAMLEDAYIHKGRLACECDQCVGDILAIALNHLPTRYVSTDQGTMYVKAQYFNPQLQSDILRELAAAARIVAERPRHAGVAAKATDEAATTSRAEEAAPSATEESWKVDVDT